MTMQQENDQLVELIIKYAGDDTTDEEKEAIQEWCNSNPDHQSWLERFAAKENIKDELRSIYEVDTAAALKKSHTLIYRARFITRLKWTVITLIVLVTLWLIAGYK
jgi:ferric-dicitrate binding protein FerR (iron transport regulator)